MVLFLVKGCIWCMEKNDTMVFSCNSIFTDGKLDNTKMECTKQLVVNPFELILPQFDITTIQ